MDVVPLVSIVLWYPVKIVRATRGARLLRGELSVERTGPPWSQTWSQQRNTVRKVPVFGN